MPACHREKSAQVSAIAGTKPPNTQYCQIELKVLHKVNDKPIIMNNNTYIESFWENQAAEPIYGAYIILCNRLQTPDLSKQQSFYL